MYKINDTVIYSSHGVCKIDAVEKHDFSGEPKEYYVLRPVGGSKNTFYIPTDNEILTSQMRKILSCEEIDSLIKIMPDENFIWIDDENQRKAEYSRILRKGDRHELIKLIKTLYIRQQDCRDQKRKLRSADEHFLKEAENMLYDEFAYVLDISKDQVIPYIQQHI